MTEETPAPGTKADLELQLARAQEELERTRGELAAARAGSSPALTTFPARPNFRGGTKISEGERQALEINGVVADSAGGGLLLASDYGVEVKTEAGRATLAREEQRREDSANAHPAPGILGVDFVYPSVARGVLAADAEVRGAVPDTTETQ